MATDHGSNLHPNLSSISVYTCSPWWRCPRPLSRTAWWCTPRRSRGRSGSSWPMPGWRGRGSWGHSSESRHSTQASCCEPEQENLIPRDKPCRINMSFSLSKPCWQLLTNEALIVLTSRAPSRFFDLYLSIRPSCSDNGLNSVLFPSLFMPGNTTENKNISEYIQIHFTFTFGQNVPDWIEVANLSKYIFYILATASFNLVINLPNVHSSALQRAGAATM